MKTLSALLAKRKTKPQNSLTDKDIFYVFSRIIKEEFGSVGSAKLVPDFLKNKTLFVKAKSGMWGGELFLNRGRILKKMKEELGEGEIEEIKLK